MGILAILMSLVSIQAEAALKSRECSDSELEQGITDCMVFTPSSNSSGDTWRNVTRHDYMNSVRYTNLNHNVGFVDDAKNITFLSLLGGIKAIAIPRDQEDFHDACNLEVPTSASGKEEREQIVFSGVTATQGTWGESDTQMLRVNFANGYGNYYIGEVVLANRLDVSEQDFSSGNTSCGADA